MTWVIEFRDSYKINWLRINNWSYTANALDYWTFDVVYITLGHEKTMSLDFKALDPTLAEVSAVIAKSRSGVQTEIPELLFHYTTASGMRGILDSARLWATNYRFLNDASEVAHGANLFESLIQERLVKVQNNVVSEFLTRTLRTVNGFDGMFDCY
jgi:hypothetical protein